MEERNFKRFLKDFNGFQTIFGPFTGDGCASATTCSGRLDVFWSSGVLLGAHPEPAARSGGGKALRAGLVDYNVKSYEITYRTHMNE